MYASAMLRRCCFTRGTSFCNAKLGRRLGSHCGLYDTDTHKIASYVPTGLGRSYQLSRFSIAAYKITSRPNLSRTSTGYASRSFTQSTPISFC